MILTVTLNAALDVTYRVPDVAWHGVNRVTEVAQRAGGKGINVTRVLTELGTESLATGLLGGATGDLVRQELAEAGLAESFTPVAGETRRTLVVTDTQAGASTLFNERGPTVTAAEWQSFIDHYRGLLDGVSAVVLSGSLPPGVPADAYATLTAEARRTGVPAIFDADGDALQHGVRGGPAIAAPNADELARATGELELPAGARTLVQRGAGAVVVSLGSRGVIAWTPEGAWQAAPPHPVSGNPTGCGDALVAALARGLTDGRAWPQRLADAVALSAAAVLAPQAGDVDAAAYAQFLPETRVDPVGDDCGEAGETCPS